MRLVLMLPSSLPHELMTLFAPSFHSKRPHMPIYTTIYTIEAVALPFIDLIPFVDICKVDASHFIIMRPDPRTHSSRYWMLRIVSPNNSDRFQHARCLAKIEREKKSRRSYERNGRQYLKGVAMALIFICTHPVDYRL